MPSTAALDDVDLALLAALQSDARLSQGALGARVGLSAAAVNRRIRRLTDDGYIRRTSAVLNPSPLGYPLTVIVQIEMVSEETERLDQLQRDLTACQNVQQCYYVTGEWDIILIVLVPDMDHYRRLTRDLFFASGNVKRFKTLVVMNHAKVSLDVPLSTPDGRPPKLWRPGLRAV
jgi:Lrp/AsnC family transcriptional regulator, leucine-responsive regulatory protein